VVRQDLDERNVKQKLEPAAFLLYSSVGYDSFEVLFSQKQDECSLLGHVCMGVGVSIVVDTVFAY